MDTPVQEQPVQQVEQTPPQLQQEQQATPQEQKENGERLIWSAKLLGGKSKGAAERLQNYQEGFKKAQEEYHRQNPQQQAPTQQQQPQNQQQPAQQQTPPTQQQGQQNNQPAADEIKTDFGTIKIPGVQQPNTPQAKTLEEAFGLMKDDLGFEVKTAEDLISKKDTLKSWRSKSQKYDETEKKLNDYNTFLSSLDPDLQIGINAAAQGKDWKKEVESYNGTRVNLNTKFEDQDAKKMVKTLMPDAFSDEELNGIDMSAPPKEFQIALNASKDKFNLLKQQRQSAIEQHDKDVRAFKEKYDASVSASMTKLTEMLPGFTDQGKIAAVKQSLENLPANTLRGTNLGRLLLKDDGTVSDDAAAKIAYMEHGHTITNALIGRVQELVKSQVREEFVQRGNQQPNVSTGHNTGNDGKKVPKEVEQKRNFLKKVTGKGRY